MSVKTPSGSTPSREEQAREILSLREQLAHGRSTGPTIKIPPPDKFSGGPRKLRTFLANAKMYLRYYQSDLPNECDKVMTIGRYLDGDPAEWYEPHLRKWLDKDPDTWTESVSRTETDVTEIIFRSYELFEEELTKLFGSLDENLQAERKLYQLKQVGSVTKYYTEFRKITSVLGWDDDALVAQFHQGLKKEIKREMIHQERPDDLHEYAEQVIKVDNRLYEFRQSEDRPQHHRVPFGKKKHLKKRTWGDPMELDSIRKGPPPRNDKKPLNTRQEVMKKKGTCYNCGKPGHFSRNCKEKKQFNMVGRPEPEPNYEQSIILADGRTFDDADDELFSDWESVSTETERQQLLREHKVTQKKPWKEPPRSMVKGKGALEAALVTSAPREQMRQVPHLQIRALIGKNAITVMIDSGSHGNYIDTTWAKNATIPWTPKEYPYKITTIDGGKIGSGNVTAETEPVKMTIQGHTETIKFDLLSMEGHDMVLGIPWLAFHNPQIDWKKGRLTFPSYQCRNGHEGVGQHIWENENLGTTRRVWAAHHQTEPESTEPDSQQKLKDANSIPVEYQDLHEVFRDLQGKDALPEHQPWDHEIRLKEGKSPSYLPLYQLTYENDQELKRYLKENLAKGYIRESKSPAASPIIFVPKSDGSKRLCVDYRKLNDITVKNCYPLPLISEMQQQLQGATVFTKLDVRDAFHRIRIKEGDEWKTAFRTKYGLYEYKVMPFGLTNAPATFQALINDTIRPWLGICAMGYLDDIIIYSKEPQNHVKDVRNVLKALLEKQLRVKQEKCEFGVKTTKFLGYVISPEEIQTDQAKVKTIQEWPQPQNVRDVQSFLGLANYYRKFIKGYSKIATPLTRLTRKDQEWEWKQEQEKAFRELKGQFSKEPVLAMYDPEKEITLETDASDYAIGAVLSQPDQNGKLHPVMFHSRKFLPAEINYDVHDKELLAIVDAFEVWESYLSGTKHQVKVITDHQNLTYFTTTKKLSRRQARWSEKLQHCNFAIQYRKGTENGRADAISRRSDYQQDMPDQDQQILKKQANGDLTYANPQGTSETQLSAVYRVETTSDQEIIDAYDNDSMAQELKKRKETDGHIHETPDGYIRFYGKVYVPTSQRERIIEESHGKPTTGHQGYHRTWNWLKERYYFPNMKDMVRESIKKCDSCLRNKHVRHEPYGHMQITEVPDRPFASIAMDWITKLPPSEEPMTKQKYDSIWVVVDRLTKFAYFLPYKESSTTEALVYQFLRNIVAVHGAPEEIYSDRDKWLTSKFWKTTMTELGIKQKMSTAYHPQTDGQAERTNQTLEQYLRHYLNYGQNNWVQLLPTAQMAYNNARVAHQSVPFTALFGYEPWTYGEPAQVEGSSQNATQRMKIQRNLHEQISQDLRFIAYKSAKYYDKNRLSEPTLKEGDKAYLLKRNIRTKRPSAKLDHIRIGPFKILERTSRVNYKLQLPETMKIHPVFHISLLEKAPNNIPLNQETIEVETDTEEYEVEDILDVQKIGKENFYLVKWKGFSTAENTWEPAKHFRTSQDLLLRFHRRNPPAEPETTQQGNRRSTRLEAIEHSEPRVHRMLTIRRQPLAPPNERARQSTQARETSFPSLVSSKNHIPPSTSGDALGSPSSSLEVPLASSKVTRSPTPRPPLRLPVRRRDSGVRHEDDPTWPLEVALEYAGDTETEEFPEYDDSELQETSDEYPELSDSEFQRVCDEHTEMALECMSKKNWREAIEKMKQNREARQNLRSSAVTTKSQTRLPLMQREQRPDVKSTRHSEPADLQREQGVGMLPPRDHTKPDREEARSVEEDGTLGIVSKKREHWNPTEGDHTHPLYPTDQDGSNYYGCRDDTSEERSECYGPRRSKQEVAELLDNRGRDRTPRRLYSMRRVTDRNNDVPSDQ
jgi:RNase H-like domain found in reverse transcriptase/Reverse transcriptase (RNA-dependent DNA polymerase)/Integrase zinc binding domain/Chromo (CHRromatin Organisation MOdifier) domain/Retrotransposon gag protein/Zinc knuckle/Retroviral aspartyl protease